MSTRANTAHGGFPGWLKPANRVIVALQRMGLALGTMRVLSVPGRKSGNLQTTPVSPLTVGGKLYVVGGTIEADWVKNARAAGWGVLKQGRRSQRVALVELPVAERPAILREFPRLVPGGISFMRRLHNLPFDAAALPEAFAAIADRATVFRINESPR